MPWRHGRSIRMVILVIDENGILAVKSERKPPIAIDVDSPMAREICFESMPLPSRHIDLLRFSCCVTQCQLVRKFGGVLGLNSSLRTGEEVLVNFPAAKAQNHAHQSYCVTLRYTDFYAEVFTKLPEACR